MQSCARLKQFTGLADRTYMQARAIVFIWGLLFCAALLPLHAQSSNDSSARSRILALEHAWNQAEALKDLAALDALFEDRLTYVDSDGSLLTKADFLNHVKNAHVEQIVTESMTAQVFGSTAIVTGTYRASAFKGAKPIIRRGRFVDAWVFKDNKWVCVAAQSTPISN
jgi:hypothetical protein